MGMSNDKRLGSFLTEVSNWHWDEFWEAERSGEFTTNQSIIFALVRSCAAEKMDAIKLALNRLDGKLKTPIKIETPKVYYIFPHAKQEFIGPDSVASAGLDAPNLPVEYDKPPAVVTGELLPVSAPSDPKPEAHDIKDMGLRDTISAMADYPRELPEAIINLATETEVWLRKQGPKPAEIPLVKSVVAAHLLTLAQKRNIDALYEVFDAIDGKLVETIKVLGEDIYITDYRLTAPKGAYLNENGILQLEASTVQDTWAAKLGATNGKR